MGSLLDLIKYVLSVNGITIINYVINVKNEFYEILEEGCQ